MTFIKSKTFQCSSVQLYHYRRFTLCAIFKHVHINNSIYYAIELFKLKQTEAYFIESYDGFHMF